MQIEVLRYMWRRYKLVPVVYFLSFHINSRDAWVLGPDTVLGCLGDPGIVYETERLSFVALDVSVIPKEQW